MRLIKLKLKDFRRFAGDHSLDLNEDLIALVGPNEAGKSSILAAIEMLGRGKAGGQEDVTRGAAGPAIISGLYVLEGDDMALLADIHEGPQVTHLWVEVSTAGTHTWRPEPAPARDLRPRRASEQLLDALSGDPGLDSRYSAEGRPWDPELLARTRQVLASTAESLREEAIGSLETLADRLRAIHYPPAEEEGAETEEEKPESSTDEGKPVSGGDAAHTGAEERETAAAALTDLAATERRPTPIRQVIDALAGRPPHVAFFDEEDRALLADYQLAEVAASPPPALRNLCDLADLDLAVVQNDLTNGRMPHIESVFEKANARLKQRFQAAWTQSTIYPRLSTPLEGVLRVWVSTEGGDYSYPRERSDGLRWFMALQAFLVARDAGDLILLVDEAETHLHYDAQADLVDALMSQQITSKVIYTTHSVGCLPPDLGCGIRAVLAESDAERSRISNSYWSVDPPNDDKVGYTPLLFAMGARLLSLTIPRYGVIGEGPSEAILLPSLLREAANIDRLSYRIVPGLSELKHAEVVNLSHHAGKVVIVTDDDLAGQAIRTKLINGGFPQDSMFHLGSLQAGCTLEDLVTPDVLASALNAELETWAIGPLRIAPGELPGVGRWAWLEAQGLATATPVERLSKARVAQRVVDIGRMRDRGPPRTPMVAPAFVDGLRLLHEALSAALGIPHVG